VGRRGFPHRRVVACRDVEEAPASIAALKAQDDSLAALPEGPEGERLVAVARGWLAGAPADWTRLHAGRRRLRVPLPTYPFERESYWIPAPGAAGAPSAAVPAAIAFSAGEAHAETVEAAAVSTPAAAAQVFHPRPKLFNAFEEARDEGERKVVQIWQEILGVEPVGVHDNFFQLGGHSLLATQVLSRVREGFGVEFPLAHLFSFPTAAELAEAIGFLLQESRGGGAAGEAGTARIERSALRASGGPFPLSFSQQRLWLIDQLEPGNPLYNELRGVRIAGRLAVPALAASLAEIVRRHEALRTTFALVEETPVQRIAPHLDLPLPVIDLEALPAERREAELRRLAIAETRRPFDLARGPLLRTRLLRVDSRDHLLLLNVHHIASDGWSTAVIVREAAALYRAFSAGEPSPLPELPIQYADFAHWQREWLRGSVLEELIAYWTQELGGAPAVLSLPTDRPRPPAQSYEGGSEPLALSARLTRALEELSEREGVTLFMTLLTAFQALLHRASGQEDILIGSPIANRNRPEIEDLIGFFVNTLVLRGRPSRDLTFRQLLAQTRTAALGAYAHQDLPFEKLVEELRVERTLAHSPLFQVMFALHNVPAESLAMPGMTLTPWEVHGGMARFELLLAMTQVEGGITGTLEYRTDLFEAATVRRLTEHFRALLEEVSLDPGRRLSDLILLTAAERHQVVTEWNDAATDFAEGDRCLHELIAAQAERTPERVAVVDESGQITYRELEARAGRLAGHLRSLGVGPEVLVAVGAERSVQMVVGLLAVLEAGGAYVPLDSGYPDDRLGFMLEDSGAPVLLADERLAPRLARHGEARLVVLDGGEEGWSDAGPARVRTAADCAAYAIYTSGSTGRPKGVINTHRGIVNRLRWMQETYRLSGEDRVLQKTPASFDVSVWEFFWPLMVGARLVMARPGGHQDAAYLAQTIAREGITTMHFVPSMLGAFLEEMEISRCSSLKRVFCSGEALPFALQQRFHALVDAELHNLYGPTEAAVDVTFQACLAPAPGITAADRAPIPPTPPTPPIVPIGRPVANTRIHLLDSGLWPVPLGTVGELYIGGVQLARGYLGRPDLTAERFVPDPFAALRGEPGARLYRTGDLARHLPDGVVEYLGRLDHQVKVRGLRIELGEIEAAIREQAAVADCAVLAREEAGGSKLLAAYVVGPQGPAMEEGLRRLLEKRLPEYMVPAAFVFLDALPLTPNGKVDRRALAALRLERTAQPASRPPRTRREKILAAIWEGVLGLDRVSVHDNFFKLGGDSILSIQIAARARRAGLVITPKQLFERPTVALLAEVAQVARIDAEQGPVDGPAPLTPIQRFFFEQELEEPDHFNQAVILETPADLDIGVLAAALATLVRHHDALRLRFVREGADWHQFHAPAPEPASAAPLTAIDLSPLPARSRRPAMARAMAAAQRGLDLARGPLLRAVWFDLGPRSVGRLLVAVHHLVVDGISWQILLEDLETAYQQLAAGREAELPAKTVSWRRWAELLSWQVRSGALKEELAFWLAQPAEAMPLPVDGPGGANTVGRSASLSLELSFEETEALLLAAPAAYRTGVADLLLTALVQAFARWTGEDRLLLHLEGHGREEILDDLDLSRT
ncbi:MAG TPA: amino acid adenylation domain-containing protein, partial [Thermoanaerobaculia bacterium]|nr:amino acid adenylation domain-containing protein [Thermoanaerobaculia bacterium]